MDADEEEDDEKEKEEEERRVEEGSASKHERQAGRQAGRHAGRCSGDARGGSVTRPPAARIGRSSPPASARASSQVLFFALI